MPEQRLRNQDRTDREVLMTIRDAADNDGYATTGDIATQLGFSANGNKGTAAMRITTRLAWMRRYGFLERREPGQGESESSWRLTTRGTQLLNGKLSRAVEKSMERMTPGTKLLLMRQLVRRGYIEADATEATALRREYQHNVAQRPRV